MSNKPPDRYTVLQRSIKDLPDVLGCAAALDLHYFILRQQGTTGRCKVFLFFDQEGMNKYLSGEWQKPQGEQADD